MDCIIMECLTGFYIGVGAIIFAIGFISGLGIIQIMDRKIEKINFPKSIEDRKIKPYIWYIGTFICFWIGSYLNYLLKDHWTNTPILFTTVIIAIICLYHGYMKQTEEWGKKKVEENKNKSDA